MASNESWQLFPFHDDVIKWKHFSRYWPFVRGSPRSPVNSPHNGQWRGALMFSLIYGRINREAGDLRRQCAHYDVIVVYSNETVKTLCYWNFVRGIERLPADSPHKGVVMQKALPHVQMHHDLVVNPCLVALIRQWFCWLLSLNLLQLITHSNTDK